MLSLTAEPVKNKLDAKVLENYNKSIEFFHDSKMKVIRIDGTQSPETITNIEIKDFARKGISKKCGIETLKYHTYSTKLSPGSSKNIYLTIKTFGENCELKQGETGSTELEIYYLPNNVGEYYIPITDVTLNYKI